MATPTQLRNRVAGLTTLAARDLQVLWRKVTTAAQAEVALNDVLPALIETYGVAAGAVAAEWYDQAREKAGVGGSFRAAPAIVPDPGVPALIGFARSQATTVDTILPLVVGGLQRRIANVSRDTVMGSTRADPKGVGWKRIGVGECAFCRMLIERDQLYREATADFASHDNCLCQAYPLIKGAEPIDVKKYAVSARRTLDPDGKPLPDADFERAKKWIAEHP